MPKILVTEDEPGIRTIVGKVLEEAGYVVALACNGVEALEHMRGAPPDCIVLDLSMPDMDGRSFLAAWRAEPTYTKVPVVLFTSEPHAVTIAAELEAQAYISKPFELDTVTDTIGRLLGPSAAVQPEALIERGDLAEDARRGWRGRESLRPLPPGVRHYEVLRQRAQLTRLAIARSQRTISLAEDYLDRVW